MLPAAGSTYFTIQDCNATQPLEQFAVIMHNNSIYAPNASVSIDCAGVSSFAEWQATGFDSGSNVYESPSIDQIIAWGRQVLGMQLP